MIRLPTSIAASTLAALLAASMACAPAHAAGGIKAAYVEGVIPSRTFSDSMTALNSPVSVGPGSGILGVTSLTLTNFDSGPQQLYLFAPVLAAGCGSAILGGGTPGMQVIVQAYSTLQLTFPTPLVFNPINGVTCVSAEVTTILHGGSVRVDVNGIVN